MQNKEKIWVLTTVDDRQVLGEKAVVTIFRKLSCAKRALNIDLKAVMTHLNLSEADLEKDMNAMFIQTRDKKYCWFIEGQEV